MFSQYCLKHQKRYLSWIDWVHFEIIFMLLPWCSSNFIFLVQGQNILEVLMISRQWKTKISFDVKIFITQFSDRILVAYIFIISSPSIFFSSSISFFHHVIISWSSNRKISYISFEFYSLVKLKTNFLVILQSFYVFNFASTDLRIYFSKACLHKFFITHKRDTSIPQIGYSTNQINVTKCEVFHLFFFWKTDKVRKKLFGGVLLKREKVRIDI